MQTYHSVHMNNSTHSLIRKQLPWRVALTANLIDDFKRTPSDPPDAGAEFVHRQTIEAIAAALETEGHHVLFLQADYSLAKAFRS
jgi:hypothetical protein